MKMDLQTIMKARGAWKTFNSNHPNFKPFLNDVANRGIKEGTQLTITVQYPDGYTMNCGIKAKDSDVDLFEMFRSL